MVKPATRAGISPDGECVMSAEPPIVIRALDTLVWWHLPRVIPSRPVKVALTDGAYLRAWPFLGAVLAPASLAVGVLVGWRPWSNQEIYTASLPAMVVLIGIGSLGASLGAWAVAGYVIGDLTLRPHGVDNGVIDSTSRVDHIIRIGAPLLIGYLLLAMVLVLAPLAARGIGYQLAARFRGSVSTAIAAVASAAMQGVLVWAWTQSVPALIRPLYTWQNSLPTVEVMAPLQNEGTVLVVVAVVMTAVRAVVENLAKRRPLISRELPPIPPVTQRHVGSTAIGLVMRTALTTLLMAGLFAGWLDACLFAVAFASILLLRNGLPSYAPMWIALVERVPILFRLLLGLALSYLVAQAIVASASSTDSFAPILISATASLLIIALLLPRPAIRTATNRDVTATGEHFPNGQAR